VHVSAKAVDFGIRYSVARPKRMRCHVVEWPLPSASNVLLKREAIWNCMAYYSLRR
jgi:hypothetical protein